MGAIKRARAILDVLRTDAPAAIARGKGMVNGYQSNSAIFVTPVPTIAALNAQIVVVGNLQAIVATRVYGAAATRNFELGVLMGLLNNGRGYVQGLADNAQSYDQAVSIIKAGGLFVAELPSHAKALLTVRQSVSGAPVVLDANVGMLTNKSKKGRFFGWQYTADGKTFVSLPTTSKGVATVTGLTALTTYGFRVNVTLSDGITQPWSQIVDFLVH
jgi:hypothetical protein